MYECSEKLCSFSPFVYEESSEGMANVRVFKSAVSVFFLISPSLFSSKSGVILILAIAGEGDGSGEGETD